MTILKSRAFLLMVCWSITFASCKKQEVLPSEITDPPKATYLSIGTIIGDSSSLIKRINYGDNSMKNVKGKVSWIETNPGGFNPGWGSTPYAINPFDILSDTYTIRRRIALSENGLYAVDFQGDGNLVIYQLSSYNGSIVKALWASQTVINVNSVNFGWDGNINVQRNEANGAVSRIWHSNTGGHSNTGSNRNMWIMQNDGNFVGYPMFTIPGYGIAGPPFADTGTNNGRVVQGGRVNILR